MLKSKKIHDSQTEFPSGDDFGFEIWITSQEKFLLVQWVNIAVDDRTFGSARYFDHHETPQEAHDVMSNRIQAQYQLIDGTA